MLELEMINKLYNLYLMLLGGYVLLLIFTIGYIVAIYRLYKNMNKIMMEEVNNEVYYNKSINN